MAEFHVQFESEVRRGRVVRAKAARMTLGPPADALSGTITSKFRVEIPDSAFLRMIPEVNVEIPEGWWTSQPVHVIVPEPEGEQER